MAFGYCDHEAIDGGNDMPSSSSASVAVGVPWRAWFGDTTLDLTFPASWQVRTYPMADAPDIGPEGIERALSDPIGAPTIEEVARGKRSAVVVVDDISRPTPASRFLPGILRRLQAAGIDEDHTRIILAVGSHRPMLKDDMLKKLGPEVCERIEVFNHHTYENLADLGKSSRGTPIHINRFYLEAEVRIGIGCITPHGGPGFGGGAKIVLPGIAGIETLAWNHRAGGLKGGLAIVEGNEVRADMEEIAQRVGIDLIANVVPNSRRGIAGLFVGHVIAAHRAGVELARRVYATRLPEEPVDVVVTNSYPKDTDFMQAGMAMQVLASARQRGREVLKPGGTVVITTASPEGRGFHSLYSPGMRHGRVLPRQIEYVTKENPRGPVYFSPDLGLRDANNAHLVREWDRLIELLESIHGPAPSVAVFPTGSIQLAADG